MEFLYAPIGEEFSYSRSLYFSVLNTEEDLNNLHNYTLMSDALRQFEEAELIDEKYLFDEKNAILRWIHGNILFMMHIFSMERRDISTSEWCGADSQVAADLGFEDSFTVRDFINFAEVVFIDLLDESNITAWTNGDFSLENVVMTPVVPSIASRGLTMRFTMGSETFLHNGEEKQAPAAPFMHEGRTMLPLRIIAEALGGDVEWHPDSRSVSVIRRRAFASLVIDTPLPSGMGTPVIVNGSAFAPIRYISRVLRANVRWDFENNAIYIT
jgi:hypothetical protein